MQLFVRKGNWTIVWTGCILLCTAAGAMFGVTLVRWPSTIPHPKVQPTQTNVQPTQTDHGYSWPKEAPKAHPELKQYKQELSELRSPGQPGH